MKITLLLSLIALSSPGQVRYPAAPQKPVLDTYHGVRVEDNYRWLEDYTASEVKQWTEQENIIARKFLDRPERDAIYNQLLDWDSHRSAGYSGVVFLREFLALKDGPGIQHPILVAFHSPEDLSSERVVVDPSALDPKHATAIDFFEPSLDGRYVAVSLSSGGSERGDARVFETATGKPTGDVVPGVNGGTAGGSLAWNGDGSGFFYTRYPRNNERPKTDLDFYQQVYFHRLGSKAEQDTYAIGKDFPRIAETALQTSPDGRYICAEVANGDGGEYEFFVRMPGGNWEQLATFADHAIDLVFGAHDDAFILSRQGAPRGKVLRMRLNQSIAQAHPFVSESERVLNGMLSVPSGLYVRELIGGPSQIAYFPLAGGLPVPVPNAQVSAILGMSRAGGDKLLFNSTSYLKPANSFLFDPSTGKVAETAMRCSPPISTQPYEVIRDYATSKDGAKIPVSIIKSKSVTLDGSSPLILTGYGGYDISEEPTFRFFDLLLLQRGFVLARANLRGGGEFGEQWHEQGKLTHKQNVFDDFAAVAGHLIDRKYTSRDKLGIMGGSNGGLLMGAELTQHPELFRAVVSFVGIYDMLRVELSSNGAFNVTEFGTVKEADQFRALYAYSPYHHVKNGSQYPATLFLTGDNDPRVDPMQSRKMTARLQATGTEKPVLLLTSSSSGHGIGTAKNEFYSQIADAVGFFIAELR